MYNLKARILENAYNHFSLQFYDFLGFGVNFYFK